MSRSTTMALAVLAGVCGVAMVTLLPKPPKPLPDRLAIVAEKDVQIDNDDGYSTFDWHHKYNPLGFANAARVPFFLNQLVRHFKQNLHADDLLSNGNQDLLANKTILDVGCGGGLLTEEIAKRTHAHVIGIDINHASIDKAQRHSSLPLDRLSYIRGSAYDLPFDDNSIDAVICSDVFEHLHDLSQAMREISRVLRRPSNSNHTNKDSATETAPGGVLVYDTVNRTKLSWYLTIVIAQRWLGYVHDHAHDWRLYIKPEEMLVVAQRAGLQHASLHDSSTLCGMRPTLPFPWTMARRLLDGAGAWSLLDRWTLTNHIQASYLSVCTKV